MHQRVYNLLLCSRSRRLRVSLEYGTTAEYFTSSPPAPTPPSSHKSLFMDHLVCVCCSTRWRARVFLRDTKHSVGVETRANGFRHTQKPRERRNNDQGQTNRRWHKHNEIIHNIFVSQKQYASILKSAKCCGVGETSVIKPPQINGSHSMITKQYTYCPVSSFKIYVCVCVYVCGCSSAMRITWLFCLVSRQTFSRGQGPGD